MVPNGGGEDCESRHRSAKPDTRIESQLGQEEVIYAFIYYFCRLGVRLGRAKLESGTLGHETGGHPFPRFPCRTEQKNRTE